MPTIWTLSANNVVGGSDGQKLAGCHITTNAAGTAYVFTKPNINEVLATAGPPLPVGAFAFPSFNYKDIDNWGITSNPPVPGQNLLGSWVVPSQKRTGQQSGTYTATADGTVYEADEAASSAKA